MRDIAAAVRLDVGPSYSDQVSRQASRIATTVHIGWLEGGFAGSADEDDQVTPGRTVV